MTSNNKVYKMRAQRDRKKTNPKGKKKLENNVDATKNLPLSRKSVYIDMKRGKPAELMEEHLLKLGAKIEAFLSAEINYVISSFGPSKTEDVQKCSDENPQSPLNSVASPFSCVPSPSTSGTTESKKSAVSRGKTLAHLARSKNQTSTVVTNAEKMGVKVISVEVANKWMERELKKLEKDCIVSNNKAEDTSEKPKSPRKERKTRSKFLKGSYIKFEAGNCHYRPVKSELEKWPKVNLFAPPGLCPFAESKAKVKHCFVPQKVHGRTQLVINQRKEKADNVENTAEVKKSSTKETQEDKSLSQCKQAPQELVATPITTAGDVKRNHTFKKNTNINKQQGYCDCCEMKFKSLDKHLRGEEHQAFARDKSKYESLDNLITEVPSTIKFLQAVLLTHCMQKQKETAGDISESTTSMLQLSASISPLSKVGKASSLAVGTLEGSGVPPLSLNTPQVCPAEISPSRDQLLLLATDTDTASQTETTPQALQVAAHAAISQQGEECDGDASLDQRPQAVVIRRPVPSGIFTSPRRHREPTPSKSTWVMERSMVFRDSPMASLQPSPCSGSPSFSLGSGVMKCSTLTPVTNATIPLNGSSNTGPSGSIKKQVTEKALLVRAIDFNKVNESVEEKHEVVSQGSVKIDAGKGEHGNVNGKGLKDGVTCNRSLSDVKKSDSRETRVARKKDVVRRLSMENVVSGNQRHSDADKERLNLVEQPKSSSPKKLTVEEKTLKKRDERDSARLQKSAKGQDEDSSKATLHCVESSSMASSKKSVVTSKSYGEQITPEEITNDTENTDLKCCQAHLKDGSAKPSRKRRGSLTPMACGPPLKMSKHENVEILNTLQDERNQTKEDLPASFVPTNPDRRDTCQSIESSGSLLDQDASVKRSYTPNMADVAQVKDGTDKQEKTISCKNKKEKRVLTAVLLSKNRSKSAFENPAESNVDIFSRDESVAGMPEKSENAKWSPAMADVPGKEVNADRLSQIEHSSSKISEKSKHSFMQEREKKTNLKDDLKDAVGLEVGSGDATPIERNEEQRKGPLHLPTEEQEGNSSEKRQRKSSRTRLASFGQRGGEQMRKQRSGEKDVPAANEGATGREDSVVKKGVHESKTLVKHKDSLIEQSDPINSQMHGVCAKKTDSEITEASLCTDKLSNAKKTDSVNGIIILPEQKQSEKILTINSENKTDSKIEETPSAQDQRRHSRFCKQFTYKGLYANNGLGIEEGREDYSVIVPNIAERVKSRVRAAYFSEHSADDADVEEGSTGEKNKSTLERKVVKVKRRGRLRKQPRNEGRMEKNEDPASSFQKVEKAEGKVPTSNDEEEEDTCHDIVVPNIADCVKRRRSCTMFNHSGQYANSGEGSDSEQPHSQSRRKRLTSNRRGKISSYSPMVQRDYLMDEENDGSENQKLMNNRINPSENQSINNDIKLKSLECKEKRKGTQKMSVTQTPAIRDCVETLKENEPTASNEQSIPLSNRDKRETSIESMVSNVADKNSHQTEDGNRSPAIVIRRRKTLGNLPFSHKQRPDVDWGKYQQDQDVPVDESNTSCLKKCKHNAVEKPDHKQALPSGDVQGQNEALVVRRGYHRRSLPTGVTEPKLLANGTKPEVRSGSPRIKIKFKKLPSNEGYSSILEEHHEEQQPGSLLGASRTKSHIDKRKRSKEQRQKISLDRKLLKNMTPKKESNYSDNDSVDLLLSSPQLKGNQKNQNRLGDKDHRNEIGLFHQEEKSLDLVEENSRAENKRPKSPHFSSPVAEGKRKQVKNKQMSKSRAKSPVFNKTHKANERMQRNTERHQAVTLQQAGLEASVHVEAKKPKARKRSDRKGKRLRCLSGSTSPRSPKRVKLSSNWQLASMRSMQQFVDSDQDSAASFHGFHNFSDKDLPSNMSFDNASEIELDSTGGKDWVVDSEEGSRVAAHADTAEKEIIDGSTDGSEGNPVENYAALVPTFSSPGKATDSSWDDVCHSYLSTLQKHNRVYSPAKHLRSPRRTCVKQSHVSPDKRAVGTSNTHSSKSNTEGNQNCIESERYVLASPKQKNTASPLTKSHRGAVGNMLGNQTPKLTSNQNQAQSPIVRVDRVVSFNLMSPQKLKPGFFKGGESLQMKKDEEDNRMK